MVLRSRPIDSTIDRGHLTFADVQTGIEHLANDARAYSPDCIFGINRGGAIVGGMIAKKIGMPAIHLLQVNCDLPANRRVVKEFHTGEQSPLRILLVDDSRRKGEHMREATAYLRKTYPKAVIRRMVLLEASAGFHPGPEVRAFRDYAVDVRAYRTNNFSVGHPWDLRP